MRTVIENFNKQFEYEPTIQNAGRLKKFTRFIVSGMGGSHLAADLLKTWQPDLDVIIHKSYGLPEIKGEKANSRLFIASSYSGNTEEVVSGLEEAIAKKIPALAISVGGKIMQMAKKHSLPYIQMPDTGIQPRNALGFSFLALLKAMGETRALSKTQELSKTFLPKQYEDRGLEIAKKFYGSVPIIYASARNEAIAYNWKIKFNETGKIPAFYNVLPEANHNEMTGFDIKEKTRLLSEKFKFIFLEDEADAPKIRKRMAILKKLYQNRGLEVEPVALAGADIFTKIFSSLVLADWASYHTALLYKVEPEQVPMVEEFKKLIA